jgi:hypothetical protein
MSGVDACDGGEGLVSYSPSVTGGGAAFKARRCPPIFCENRFPPRPLARRDQDRGPDSHSANRPLSFVRDGHGHQQMEVQMNMILHTQAASRDAFPALVSGLRHEFGTGDVAGMAEHFAMSEAADLHWDSRSGERYLGTIEAFDGGEIELDRVAIIGIFNGAWFVAQCQIDGDGAVHHMVACHQFSSAWDAHEAWADAV